MPRNSSALHQAFRTVLRLYFPRWRSSSHWQFRGGAHATYRDHQGKRRETAEQGLCDPSLRTLWVNVPLRHPQWTLTAIHEMCHAVTTGDHGRTWQHRMDQAATRAESLGDLPLAQALRDEVAAYAAVYPLAQRLSPKRFITLSVQDCLVDNPTLTLEQVVQSIADDVGSPPQEIRQNYPWLETVYTRLAREIAEHVATIERYRQAQAGNSQNLASQS
jgi:hypothetical protein